MASLTNILQNKTGTVLPSRRVEPTDVFDSETNLFDYEIYSYTNQLYNEQPMCVDWVAPADGVAIIDIWGASGSGGRMCCCGGGIPGNPGAFARKTVNVLAGDTITGLIGHSCGNAADLCTRGERAESSGVCYVTSAGDGINCICAEGGFNGFATCTTGVGLFCCLGALRAYCGSVPTGWTENCGIICNYAGPFAAVEAAAYGGDINCTGGISKTCFGDVNPILNCQVHHQIAVSPGIITGATSYVNINGTCELITSLPAASDLSNYFVAIGNMGRTLGYPPKKSACWSSTRECGCYEFVGCVYYLPPGFPGTSGVVCADVRSSGARGGSGAVKIKFLGS